jgi:hypothetical protein
LPYSEAIIQFYSLTNLFIMKAFEHKCVISKFEEKEGNTLTADGLIRINDNKTDFGSMMLITNMPISLTNGFSNITTRVGFITGRVDELSKMIKDHEIEAGDDFCQLAGPHTIKIVEIVKSEFTDEHKSRPEHTDPEESGFRVKINPTTKEELCNADGEVIYRKTEVVPGTPETVPDRLVSFVSGVTPVIVDESSEEFSSKNKSKTTVK